MRFAVFVLSLLLIIVPTYTHALAFVPATVGMVARTAGGKFVKIATSKSMLATVGTSSVGMWCQKNPKKCKKYGDELFDIITGADDDDNTCKIVPYYNKGNDYTKSLSDAISYQLDSKFGNMDGITYRRTSNNAEQTNAKFLHWMQENEEDLLESTQSEGQYIHRFSSEDDVDLYKNGRQYLQNNVYVGMYTRLECGDSKDDDKDDPKEREEKQKQAINQLIQKLDDDDVNQIINNYYNDIDIDKYCNQSQSCAELSKEFGDDVTQNKNKYDIDKINKGNCVVENGKIISCDNAKRTKDDDDSDDKDQDKDKDQTPKDGDKDKDDDETGSNNQPKDEQCPVYLRWLCNFELGSDNEDTKLQIPDPQIPQIDTNIRFNGQCPSDVVLNGSIHGVQFEFFKFEWHKFC